VQFLIGAALQHSNTPSLRVTGFEDEDDDEDENEAPHEWHPTLERLESTLIALSTPIGRHFQGG
jgi:hypothetical protein